MVLSRITNNEPHNQNLLLLPVAVPLTATGLNVAFANNSVSEKMKWIL